MIAIVDYKVGNLFSLKSSFLRVGAEIKVTDSISEIQKADKIVLPGVGAFGDAAKKLKESGLGEEIKKEALNGKPVLGICLGMQLLFEKSFEYGVHEGLGLIKGEIVPIKDYIPKELKVPHIGWNALQLTDKKSAIFKYINDGDFVYFVHSYYADKCQDSTTAVTEYGKPLTAAVEYKNVFGCQFHPEKSGDTGLKILKAFCDTERND